VYLDSFVPSTIPRADAPTRATFDTKILLHSSHDDLTFRKTRARARHESHSAAL